MSRAPRFTNVKIVLASALLAGFVRLPCSCPDGGVVVRGLSWLGGIRRPPTIESPGPVLTLKVPLPQRASLSHILCNYPGELARKYDRFKVLPVLDVEGTPGAPVPFRCSSGTRPLSRPCPRRLGRGGAAAPGNHSPLGDNSAAEIPKSSPEPRRSSASEEAHRVLSDRCAGTFHPSRNEATWMAKRNVVWAERTSHRVQPLRRPRPIASTLPMSRLPDPLQNARFHGFGQLPWRTRTSWPCRQRSIAVPPC